MVDKIFPTAFSTVAFAVGMVLYADTGAANVAAGQIGAAAVSALNSTTSLNVAQGISATGGVSIKDAVDPTKILAFDPSTSGTGTTTTIKTGAQTGSFSVTIPVLASNATLVVANAAGLTALPSTSLTIGTIPYVWPASQGAAATILINDGAGNLTWNLLSSDATMSASGAVTLASVCLLYTSDAADE